MLPVHCEIQHFIVQTSIKYQVRFRAKTWCLHHDVKITCNKSRLSQQKLLKWKRLVFQWCLWPLGETKLHFSCLKIFHLFAALTREIRGCLHDNGTTFAPEWVHSGSLSCLYICLHDTTTKCHAGASHPGVSSPRLLYRGENYTPVRNFATVSFM